MSPVDIYLGAVHAAPGAAGEVTSVPQAAVGAELAVDPAAVAHVVQLTRGLGVRVVPGHVPTFSVVNLYIYTSGLPAIQLIFAGERGLRDIVRSVYWEVQTGSAKALGKAIIISVIVIIIIFICFNEIIFIQFCFPGIISISIIF